MIGTPFLNPSVKVIACQHIMLLERVYKHHLNNEFFGQKEAYVYMPLSNDYPMYWLIVYRSSCILLLQGDCLSDVCLPAFNQSSHIAINALGRPKRKKCFWFFRYSSTSTSTWLIGGLSSQWIHGISEIYMTVLYDNLIAVLLRRMGDYNKYVLVADTQKLTAYVYPAPSQVAHNLAASLGIACHIGLWSCKKQENIEHKVYSSSASNLYILVDRKKRTQLLVLLESYGNRVVTRMPIVSLPLDVANLLEDKPILLYDSSHPQVLYIHTMKTIIIIKNAQIVTQISPRPILIHPAHQMQVYSIHFTHNYIVVTYRASNQMKPKAILVIDNRTHNFWFYESDSVLHSLFYDKDQVWFMEGQKVKKVQITDETISSSEVGLDAEVFIINARLLQYEHIRYDDKGWVTVLIISRPHDCTMHISLDGQVTRLEIPLPNHIIEPLAHGHYVAELYLAPSPDNQKDSYNLTWLMIGYEDMHLYELKYQLECHCYAAIPYKLPTHINHEHSTIFFAIPDAHNALHHFLCLLYCNTQTDQAEINLIDLKQGEVLLTKLVPTCYSPKTTFDFLLSKYPNYVLGLNLSRYECVFVFSHDHLQAIAINDFTSSNRVPNIQLEPRHISFDVESSYIDASWYQTDPLTYMTFYKSQSSYVANPEKDMYILKHGHQIQMYLKSHPVFFRNILKLNSYQHNPMYRVRRLDDLYMDDEEVEEGVIDTYIEVPCLKKRITDLPTG